LPLAAGTTFGPYQIIDQLGAGGMGVVYRAHDSRLQRDVAIKVLPAHTLGDENARARFRREALALAKLSHPNIATLFDLGEQDDSSYLVMECVAGDTLASMLERGPLPIPDVLALGIEIAGALDEAHGQGIVHRDLKPANVIVTPKGHAKVLDFGLAKLIAPSGAGGALSHSDTIGIVGTLFYMSPEQANSEPIDARTDVWSLGVLLYEALTGSPPFQAPSTLAILHAISERTPAPIASLRPEVPHALESVVMRALAKQPADRYQSAAEMQRDLSSVLTALGAPAVASPTVSRTWLVAACVLIVAGLGIGGLLVQRSQRRHWARDQAIPEATRITLDRPLAAFLLLQRAQSYLPADSQVTELLRSSTRPVSVVSSPSGASIEVQDYSGDSSWYRLGVTPLAAAVPSGYLRWRVSVPGREPVIVAPLTAKSMHFALDSIRDAPAGMVYVPGNGFADFIAFLGWVGPFNLPSYYLDRFEVTNRAYQQFVDAGGYANSEFWTDTFMREGREVSRTDAMKLLRDSTSRPGPSTWKAGHFPAGRADDPVSGVSWYEAAAYARWAGKSLPAMAQWYYAAPPDVASATVRESNITRQGVAPVGTFHGVGPFGTYDMAGNVREWVATPVDADRRLILGASWASPSYLYSEPEALSAFDRSAVNGFRCVRNIRPVPPAALARVTPLERDFAKTKPATDAVFDAYRLLYIYDKSALDAHVDRIVHDGADWREERITFAAAYGGERVTAYLFVPKQVKPPYQTVVFFPSARVLDLSNSAALGDTAFFDYIVQSGRAVLYPVYQDTYERRVRSALPGASQEMKLTVERYKDLARSLDYLATRTDIDTTKLAYLGVSMGAAEGVIYTTLLQDRLKTDIFLDGGFFLDLPSAGRDQVDFAARLKLPVLMVNGRYDFSFSLDRSQLPLYRMLGTPDADKRHVLLETPHDVNARRPDLTKEVLAWLDHYLGPVRLR
jgi:dienelactone hydrolase